MMRRVFVLAFCLVAVAASAQVLGGGTPQIGVGSSASVAASAKSVTGPVHATEFDCAATNIAITVTLGAHTILPSTTCRTAITSSDNNYTLTSPGGIVAGTIDGQELLVENGDESHVITIGTSAANTGIAQVVTLQAQGGTASFVWSTNGMAWILLTGNLIDGSQVATGVVAVANGGTGSSTQNFVDLTTTQASIAGAKTFTGAFAIGSSLSYAAPVYEATSFSFATATVYNCDATAGAVVATLPTCASNKGRVYMIKKTDATGNACSIATVSGQLIDGVDRSGGSPLNITTQNQSDTLVCGNGLAASDSNWELQ